MEKMNIKYNEMVKKKEIDPEVFVDKYLVLDIQNRKVVGNFKQKSKQEVQSLQ